MKARRSDCVKDAASSMSANVYGRLHVLAVATEKDSALNGLNKLMG